ncbi:MAG: MobP3 family relaxase, partial [Bacillota bacterium]
PTATPETQAKEHGEDAAIHVKYMAERPRSEGLFSSDGPLDAAATKALLSKHEGIVWRAIVSLREDEAGRINHLEYAHWQESLQRALPQIAKEMGIPESNFRWAAAYHPEPGHPHCHIVFWEDRPGRVWGKLSDGERRGVKKAFVRNIYASERERLGIEKSFYRDEIKKGVRDVLGLKQAIAKESEVVRAEIGDPPGLPPRIGIQQREELDERLAALGADMPGKGRTALGYMPQNVKDEVRKIADWILEQPQFRAAVEKYLEAHTEYTRMYVHQPGQLEAARRRAYEGLRDRVCQDLLRGAVSLCRDSENGHVWKPLGHFSIANTVWKAVWHTVQRERSKAEYKTRRMNNREREDERRRREGRTR